MTQDIQVERCPSCGAPYNVTRLASGAAFECRRCGASVRVGLEAAAPPRPARGALLLAGLLLAGATALAALPWTPRVDPDVALLAAATLGSLLLALRPVPALLPVTGGLLLLLVLRAHGGDAAPAPEPATALAGIALGGGCFALCARRARGRGAARTLTLIGALGLPAALATAAALASEPLSELASRARAVADWWRGIVWQGTSPAPGVGPWSREIPWALAGAAALSGLLAAILPERRTGSLARLLARLGLLALAAAWLAPSLAATWAARDDLFGPNGGAVAHDLLADLVRGGFPWWVAGAVVLAHAAWERDAASPGGLAPAPTRAWHAAAAALAAATLLLLENPATGAVAARWPWEVLAGTPLAPAAGYAVLLGALAIGGALLAAAAPLRRGGALPLLLAALALAAVDGGATEHGVPRATMPLLAAVAAGVLWARRGGRWGPPARWAPALCGALILAVLLWPRTGDEFAVARPVGPWDCALLRWLAAVPDGLRGGELGRAFLEPGAVVVPVAALAAVTALLGAATWPARPLAAFAALLAVGAALYPVGHALVRGWSDAPPAGGVDLAAAGRAAGEALRRLPVAAIVASLAAAADAARRSP